MSLFCRNLEGGHIEARLKSKNGSGGKQNESIKSSVF